MADIRGSCTANRQRVNHELWVLHVHWTSNGSGETQQVLLPYRLDGRIICVDTWPGALPIADDYDITLTDEHGFDVMEGALADRSDTDAQRVYAPHTPAIGNYIVRSPTCKRLELQVENASVKITEGYFNIYYVMEELRHQRGK
jgi:hypothetical protein